MPDAFSLSVSLNRKCVVENSIEAAVCARHFDEEHHHHHDIGPGL